MDKGYPMYNFEIRVYKGGYSTVGFEYLNPIVYPDGSKQSEFGVSCCDLEHPLIEDLVDMYNIRKIENK